MGEAKSEIDNKLLMEINKKIDKVIMLLERILRAIENQARAKLREELSGVEEYLDAVTLLSLPDHLRRTVLSLAKLGGEATAEEVSRETGRARAVESAYLNQLVAMGYLGKKRRGRKVYFYFPKE